MTWVSLTNYQLPQLTLYVRIVCYSDITNETRIKREKLYETLKKKYINIKVKKSSESWFWLQLNEIVIIKFIDVL